MRVAITRPREDAERSAAALRRRGVAVLIEPLLEVVPRHLLAEEQAEVLPQMAQAQGWLLTSANGARALAATLHQLFPNDPGPWDRPALCVGDQTARTAQGLGFARPLSAKGDVLSLADLVCTTLSPTKGPLFQAAASVQAGDLAGDLGGRGFTVQRAVLYETQPARALSADFVRALRDHSLDAVLFYSPRTARAFATLVQDATLGPYLVSVTAYCLSQAVADALSCLSLPLVRVAPLPTQESLLSILDQDRASTMKGDTP